MRYVGIDFGTKRIGVAVSDAAASMAFPQEVIQNNKEAVAKIFDTCSVNGCQTVIVGESKDFKGQDNQVMGDIRKFADELKEKGLEVIFEPEIMSTIQAERGQGRRGDIDASAAAIILQSYLDRIGPKKTADELEREAEERDMAE